MDMALADVEVILMVLLLVLQLGTHERADTAGRK